MLALLQWILLTVILMYGFTRTSFSVELTLHRKCLSRCADEILTKKAEKYNTCMGECFSESHNEWLLKNQTSDSCELFSVDYASAPACSARDIDVVSLLTNTSHYSNGLLAVRQFVAVVWTPCPYGMDDVKGYEINLLERNMIGFSYCKQVFLSKQLMADVTNTEFSVLFQNQELDYAMDYKISIEGLPKSSYRYHAYIDHKSLSCTDLNGFGSCQCGLKGLNPAPPVNVTALGYNVTAFITVLDSCFRALRYKLSVLHVANSTIVLRTLDIVPEADSAVVRHTFSPLYPTLPAVGSRLGLQYIVFGSNGERAVSEPVVVSVIEWEPQIPYISPSKGSVRVTWNCSPSYYNITNYEMRLNWHGLHPGRGISRQTVYTVAANCSDDNKMTMTLVSVRPGIYTVQVREWRVTSPFFRFAKWSALSTSIIVIDGLRKDFVNKNDLITSAAVLFPLMVVIVLGLAILYCTKRGYCKKIHHSVPLPLAHILNSHTGFQHSSKTVWIVWQADTSDDMIEELHSENIRHFAAFLANHCGLNVILDQYETLSASSFTAWLQEKQKSVDVVIFVCPHTTQPQTHTALFSLCGNFSAVFRLYENALLSEETSVKFAMAVLPYSHTDSCTASKLLLSTTPSFMLMDDIENLYFYIQGCAKVNHFGRRVIKYIHKHEYTDTLEGNELKKGFEKMMMIRSNCVSIPSTLCTDLEQEPNTPCSKYAEDVKKIELQVARPDSPTESLFLNKATCKIKPIPPPPIVNEEDADETVFLINTRELLSLQPMESAAVSPVMFDSCSPLLPQSDDNFHYHGHTWSGQNGHDRICAALPSTKKVNFHDAVAM